MQGLAEGCREQKRSGSCLTDPCQWEEVFANAEINTHKRQAASGAVRQMEPNKYLLIYSVHHNSCVYSFYPQTRPPLQWTFSLSTDIFAPPPLDGTGNPILLSSPTLTPGPIVNPSPRPSPRLD